MKIALVCKVYPTQRPGGMAFVCQDRARALVQAGHEVRVFSTGFATNRLSRFDDEGVEVVHLPSKPTDYSREFAEQLVPAIKEFAPSIVHLDSFDNQRPWWRELQGKVKLALTMHGFCWGAYLTQINLVLRKEMKPGDLKWDFTTVLREREYMTDFNTVIGISLHEQWLLKQMMCIHDAKLVYNPLPSYFFQDPTEPPNNRRFLCAAISSHGTRGFHYAKVAAQRAGVELVIAKDIERKAMPALIDSCDGLLLPTAYAQGLDLCVGETVVRKRQVIATATGSYLREAKGGLYHGVIKLVPVVDPVDAIVEAFDARTVDYARKHLELWRHGPEIHAQKWLEVVQ